MKKLHLLLGILVVALAVTSCADVSQVQECLPTEEHTYGFWGGLWHGIIAFFSFIGSLFYDDIAVYAVNNNGGWYDFGFILGVGALGGGASSGASSRR
jgi:hypothetical protein